MSIEAIIRNRAAMGWSRTHTAKHLGVSFAKLNLMIEAMPGKPVKFCEPHKSLLKRNYYATMEQVPMTAEHRAIAAERTRERYRLYSICGVRGTIQELYDLWAEYIPVKKDTVWKRLQKSGADDTRKVYDAFFTPPIPLNVRRHRPWTPGAKTPKKRK